MVKGVPNIYQFQIIYNDRLQALSKGKYVTLMSIFTNICVGVISSRNLPMFSSLVTTAWTKPVGQYLPSMPGTYQREHYMKQKKSRIQERPNFLTDADTRTNIFVIRILQANIMSTFFIKILQVMDLFRVLLFRVLNSVSLIRTLKSGL